MEESQQMRVPLRQNPTGNNKLLKDNSLQNASGHDGSGHLADSGYTSYQSFNASSSVARSVLATIEEDNEADSSFEDGGRSETPLKTSSILTPTTAASIEQISNFHLTTPSSVTKESFGNRRALARKSSHQNLFVQRTPDKTARVEYSESAETPLRSGRKSNLGSLTPRKNKASAKRKLGNFREKLYSDGDTDQLQISLNRSDSLDCKKLDQEDISPILHAKRRRNSVIDDLMRSSTPKTASFKTSFRVETQENINWENINIRKGKESGPTRKPLTLRKIQSFSPSKMISYRKRDSVLQEKSVITNRKAPLQRQNAFFEDSLRQDSLKLSTPPRKHSLEVSSEKSFEASIDTNITPVKGIHFNALIEAPILPQSSKRDHLKQTDLDQEISFIPSFDDCSFTPSKPNFSGQTLLSEDSIVRDAPVTNLDKSIPSILENESQQIASLSIPKTPTSLNKSGRLKRLSSRQSSTKKDKTRSKPPSPKLRVHPTSSGKYRRSYVGVERLNILKRLNEHYCPALDIVLDYLTDSDLVRVVAVSRGWRSIIETHRRTNRRLLDYLARGAQIKENLDVTGSASSSSSRENSLLGLGKTLSCDKGKELGPVSVRIPRQPFSMCNSIDRNSSGAELKRTSSVQKSPPVSPSKRKFRENQKIASHLKKSERLKPCPRCEKPSRVVLSKSTVRHALATGTINRFSTAAKLEKSYTVPDTIGIDAVDSPISTGKQERIRRNLFSTSLLTRSCSVEARTPVTRAARRRSSTDTVGGSSSLLQERKMTVNGNRQPSEESQCDYAVCSGKSCGFAFCIKCLCEYHPDSECKDLAPNSPSKEEEPAHNVACSKQSRRSLLRLRK